MDPHGRRSAANKRKDMDVQRLQLADRTVKKEKPNDPSDLDRIRNENPLFENFMAPPDRGQFSRGRGGFNPFVPGVQGFGPLDQREEDPINLRTILDAIEPLSRKMDHISEKYEEICAQNKEILQLLRAGNANKGKLPLNELEEVFAVLPSSEQSLKDKQDYKVLISKGPELCSTLVKAFIHKTVLSYNLFTSDEDLRKRFDEYLLQLNSQLSFGVANPDSVKFVKGRDQVGLAKAIEFFQAADRNVLHKAVIRKHDSMLSDIGVAFKKKFFYAVIGHMPEEFSSAFDGFEAWPQDTKVDSNLKWYTNAAKTLQLLYEHILENGPRRVFGIDVWERFCSKQYDSDVEEQVLSLEISKGYVEAWGLLYIFETLRGNFKILRKSAMHQNALRSAYRTIGKMVLQDREWAAGEKKKEREAAEARQRQAAENLDAAKDQQIEPEAEEKADEEAQAERLVNNSGAEICKEDGSFQF